MKKRLLISPGGHSRLLPAWVAWLFLLIISLACALPESAIPTPTRLSTQPPPLQPSQPADETSAPFTTSPAPTRSTAMPAVPDHRIRIRRVYGLAEFYDRQTDLSFIPRGVNYFNIVQVLGWYENRILGVGVYDPAQVQADFQHIAAAGYNTLRVFIDSCNSGPGCIGLESGQGLNPAYLDNLVDMMRLAKQNGLFLLLASNDLPDQGGYADLANRGSSDQFAGYRNAYYLTPQGIQAQRNYWRDLLSGLAERQAPLDIVLGWQLLNEQFYFRDQPPFSLESGTVTTANGQSYDMAESAQKQAMAVDGMRYYINELNQVIRSIDPTALVTMGFFVPDYPNPVRAGDNRYVETASLLQAAELDFIDLHAYPGGELSLAQYMENFGLNEHFQAPVLMGEVGAFVGAYPGVESAANTIQDWIAESCLYGFDGWLYWGYKRAPEALGDATWSFTDAQGMLMDAISPLHQPDACAVTALPGRNLARGKPVTASAALPDEPPEAAVDGTPALWGAGAFATQWIEIDLGQPSTVGSIRLTVSQWPAGQTTHQLWVGAAGEPLRMLHEFDGYTQDFDLLEFTPAEPLQNVQILRLVTTSSPSWVAWREIEVLAPLLTTPTPTASPTP